MPTSAAVGKYPAALPEPLREIGEKVREIAGAVPAGDGRGTQQ